MNENQGPIGPEFKEESLNKKFSYSFTRKELIILVNVLRPMQFALNDIRNSTLLNVLAEIERTAIQSITPDDYKKEVPAPNMPATPGVAVN